MEGYERFNRGLNTGETMNWIIENLTKEPSYKELVDKLKALGRNVTVISGDYSHSMIESRQNENVIFLGCIEMNSIVGERLKQQGCYPATCATFENYLCTKYYPHFSEHLFNDNYIIVPLSELIRRKWFFWGLFGKESLLFVRPDSGEKTFKAGLFDIQDIDKLLQEVENQLVIVSSPKNIVGEFRFLVNRNEIIAVSSYRWQGLLTRVPSAPPGATEFVRKILKVGYYPDEVFCVDVAQDSDGNFWLMELTSFSSAGLYAMDAEKVILGVEKVFSKQTHE